MYTKGVEMNGTIVAVRAAALTGGHVGREVIVNGLHIGTLTDYEVRVGSVVLYLAGRVISVPRGALCAFAA